MIKISNSAEETQKFAKSFLKKILKRTQKRKQAVIIGLEGELGAGKTTFVQGLAYGLGIKEKVNSPTFLIIKKYKINVSSFMFHVLRFYHIDCYRLEKPWQIQELEFEKIINNPENIVAIEWSEKIKDILPKDTVWLKFEWLSKNKRKIIYRGA